MKFTFNSILGCIHCVVCRLDLEMITRSLDHQVSCNNGENYVINPEGPLNFLYGHLCFENGLIYNKRFISPEITRNYSLARTGTMYRFTSSPNNDSHYTTIKDNSDDDRYLASFNNMLLTFFSADPKNNIVVNRTNTFSAYLDHATDRMNMFKIFAVLMLRAKGINIPFKFATSDGNRGYFDRFLFELNGVVSTLNLSTRVLYKSAVNTMVNFFKNHALSWYTNDNVDGGFERRFSNSPHFLLQAFLYDLFKNENDVNEFTTIFHDMLSKLKNGNNDDGRGVYEKLYNECFILKADSYKKLKVMKLADLNSWEKGLDYKYERQIFVPHLISTSRYKIENGIYSKVFQDDLNNIVDTNENVLLSLFRFLLYNQTTGSYSTDHLQESNYKFKRFCAAYLNNNDAKNIDDELLHHAWNDVLGYTFSYFYPVLYTSEHKLKSGLLNFLTAIATIGGMNDSLTQIQEFLEAYIGNDCICDDRMLEELKSLSERILVQIAGKNSIRINFGHFESNKIPKKEDRKFEISMDIHIVLMAGKIKHVLKLGFREGMYNQISYRKVVSEGIEQILNELDRACEESECVLHKLLQSYVKMKINERSKLYAIDQNIIDCIVDARSDIERLNCFNTLFEKYNVSNFSMKEQVIKSFVPYLKKVFKDGTREQEEEYKQDLVVRLISNIFGSVDLSNNPSRFAFLGYMVLFNNKFLAFPSFINPKDESVVSFINFSLRSHSYDYMFRNSKYDQIYESCKEFIATKRGSFDPLRRKSITHSYFSNMLRLAIKADHLQLVQRIKWMLENANDNPAGLYSVIFPFFNKNFEEGVVKAYEWHDDIKMDILVLHYIRAQNARSPMLKIFAKFKEHINDLVKDDHDIEKFITIMFYHSYREEHIEELFKIIEDFGGRLQNKECLIEPFLKRVNYITEYSECNTEDAIYELGRYYQVLYNFLGKYTALITNNDFNVKAPRAMQALFAEIQAYRE